MGVAARIVLYANDKTSASDAAAAGFDRLAALDAMLSDYRHDSELNRIASGPVGVPQYAGDDLLAVLKEAKFIHDASGGAFDITLGHASRLWRQSRDISQLPDTLALAHARAQIGMSAVSINEAARTLTLARPNLGLDLGGIAKGYAAQQAVRTITATGHPRCMVALAGDIAMGDAPPNETGWSIAIASNADQPQSVPITLSNLCISTSGSSHQFVAIDGVRYSHLLDPRTGLGSQQTVAVTVIGQDGARTDALATALCIMDERERESLLAAFPSYRVLVHPILEQ